jgi:hypothetical protein
MKTLVIQNNFAAGVLEPRMKGRTDVPLYASGLEMAENCLTIPLGGLTRRPGLRYVDTLPRKVVENTATPTMANGGTAGNIDDFDLETSTATTVNIGTVDPYVVASYNYGAPIEQGFIDVALISITSGTTDEFYVQDSTDGITWSNVAQLPLVDTTPRNYRVRGNTKRYLRLAKIGGTDLGTDKVTLSGFWSYSFGARSDVQLLDFTISQTKKFVFALTDMNLSVYDADVFWGDIAVPFLSAEVKDVDWTRLEAVMLMVQENHAPRRLVYDETLDYFYFDEVPFATVPVTDYNDDLSPTPTKAQHRLTFGGTLSTGQLFKLSLNGYTTEEMIYYGATSAETENQIKFVLELLSFVGPGGVESVVTGGASIYDVTFSDSATNDYDNNFAGYSTSGDPTGSVTITSLVTGVPRTEPVWSSTRGYPKTVSFYQNRLWFGGTESKQQSLFGSRLNVYFDFEVARGQDSDPIFVTLDAKKKNSIQSMMPARTLSIFTDDAEYATNSGPIKTTELSVSAQTEEGSGGVPPISIDGAVLFLGGATGALREFVFSFGEDAYTATNRSIVAQSLINSPIDFDSFRPSEEDANYAVIINGDGTAVVYNTMREQSVSNFMPITTDGEFIACQGSDRKMYFGVVRELGGQDETVLERFDYTLRTDCASLVINSPASATVATLDHLDGLECRVVADGSVMNNATPSGGSITLSRTAGTIEVGLNYDCRFQPMPLAPAAGQSGLILHKKKVARQHYLVYETLGLVIDGKTIPQKHFGAAPNTPLNSAPVPYTGSIRNIEGQMGWGIEVSPLVEILDPVPFTILYIESEVEFS